MKSSVTTFLISLQIGGVIGVYHYPGHLGPALKTKMEAGLKNYGAVYHHGVNFIWDAAQTGLQCCGVTTWTDWQTVSTRGLELLAVPQSCCRNRQEDCGQNPSQENLYSQGCFTALSTAFSDNLHYIGGENRETQYYRIGEISSIISDLISPPRDPPVGGPGRAHRHLHRLLAGPETGSSASDSDSVW